MNYLTQVKAKDVRDSISFCHFCQQRLGIPFPRGKAMAMVNQASRQFFEDNPKATWGTLARTVEYCVNRNKRFPTPKGVITTAVGWAFAAGYLPELNPTPDVDEKLETAISAALTQEHDPEWRYRLVGAEGVQARREVYMAWQQKSLLSQAS